MHISPAAIIPARWEPLRPRRSTIMFLHAMHSYAANAKIKLVAHHLHQTQHQVGRKAPASLSCCSNDCGNAAMPATMPAAMKQTLMMIQMTPQHCDDPP